MEFDSDDPEKAAKVLEATLALDFLQRPAVAPTDLTVFCIQVRGNRRSCLPPSAQQPATRRSLECDSGVIFANTNFEIT